MFLSAFPPSFRNQNKGQALLLVLFVLAVVLTIGLAPLSRSVSDISISQSGQEPSRAFSAAEAGIEQALIGGSLTGNLGEAQFKAEVASSGQDLTYFLYPERIPAGQLINFWLTSHDASGNLSCTNLPCFSGDTLKVCWGESGTPNNQPATPALEIALFHANGLDFSTVEVNRWTFDPNPGRRSTNNFAAPLGASSCGISGQNFAFSTNPLGLPAGRRLLLLQATLYYNTTTSHPVAFQEPTATYTFPSQGQLVTSQGTSGQSSQTIQVFRSFAAPPTIFSSVLAAPSSGSIQKQ